MRQNAGIRPCIGPLPGRLCPHHAQAAPHGLRCAFCKHSRRDWQSAQSNKAIKQRKAPAPSGPRPTGYNRHRQISTLERLAKRLNIQAMLNQRACEKAGEAVDAKMWWAVAAAASEQIQALQSGRQSPQAQSAPKTVEPPPIERDHMGVIAPPPEKN